MSKEDKIGAEAIDKLKSIVEEVKVAMMCTLENNQEIDSRPMSTAEVDEDGILWFFTNDTSPKTDQIESKHGVCLCYSSPADNTYARIRGIATLNHNKEKIAELWNPILKAWFPEGQDDPNLALISVVPYDGQYWDGSSNKMISFIKIAKAAITNGTYDAGTHGDLEF